MCRVELSTDKKRKKKRPKNFLPIICIYFANDGNFKIPRTRVTRADEIKKWPEI